MSEEAAVILAAGQGTRMRSTLPKVLHLLAGRPMLARILDTLDRAGFPHPTVVVGYGAAQVEEEIGPRCRYVDQGEQLGTGHAARAALGTVPPSVERIVLFHGDEPLIEPETVTAMLACGRETGAAVVLLTAHTSDTRGFGRVIRNEAGEPVALLQESELNEQQRQSDEVNLGAYVFDAAFLRHALIDLEPHAPKGEYYLTDVIARAAAEGRPVAAVTPEDGAALLGINDRVHLEQASRVIYQRAARRLMESGVTIVDSASTFIDDGVEIGIDTVVLPFTMVEGGTRIGQACRIGPYARILASQIGERCQIEASTIEESVVEDNVRIGPYSHLRPRSHVGAGCEIGNYAEIKGSTLGQGTRMHHVGYVGDARVGARVNIGAGTVTCNYDGRQKHETVIGDGAFIGSDTMLIAPVTVGAGSSIGAGSVVTHDVPPHRLAIGVPARDIKDVPGREESGSDTRERSA